MSKGTGYPRNLDIAGSFELRVTRGASEDDCWVWTGSRTQYGYGRMGYNGRRYVAHRLSWELNVGPIPDGLVLDHLCRNRACVNPKHLEPVTDAVNILRGEGPAALAARKTHCPQGHPYSGENLQTYKGFRLCRTCKRKTAREVWARRKSDRSG